MDLMALSARLTLDDRDFNSGIDKAESKGESFSGKMSALTVAAGQAMYQIAAKAVSAISGMFSTAIGNYSNYEQLIGGVETLFKTSSGKVEQYAKQAYKTAGISANDYMETVTSFSASLLQGLKGDTEEAAELANTAIIDMADNANKMGTDMNSIQAAYQGFAKQNYTMLDNLKLGYGGTKEEMVRLINDSGILDHKIKNLDGITFDQLIEAIHEIQKQLGITGTTAEEAEDTIAGSKQAMEAAWNDLLTVIAGGGDHNRIEEAKKAFEDSVSSWLGNFIPTMVTTIANGSALTDALVTSITQLPSDTLMRVTGALLSTGAEIIGGVQELVNWIADQIIVFFEGAMIDDSKIQQFGAAIGRLIGSTAAKLLDNFPELVTAFINVGFSLVGSVIEGLWEGLFGTGHEVDKIQTELESKLSDIDRQVSESTALLDYMQSLIDKYGEGATATLEWQMAMSDLEEILPGAGQIFENYGKDVQGAVTELMALNDELRKAAINNALMEATQEETELYAKQIYERNQQKARINVEVGKQKSLTSGIVDPLMALAAQTLPEYEKWLEETGSTDAGLRNKLEMVSQGKSETGEMLYAITPEDLAVLASEIMGAAEAAGLDTSGVGEMTDEQIAEWQEAQNEIKKANDEVKKLSVEIEATEKTMLESKMALQMSMEELYGTSETVASDIKTGGKHILQELDSLAGKIATYVAPSGHTYTPMAIGMDYIPYDGFRAELHRGEAVLTKEENARRRGGADYTDMEAALEEAIERSMSRMYFNVNGERVADLTTRRTEQNISATERARTRSMGG